MEDGLNLKFKIILSNVGIINRIPSENYLWKERKELLRGGIPYNFRITYISQLPAASESHLQHS